MSGPDLNAVGAALAALALPGEKVVTVSFTHIAHHHELDGPGFGASVGDGRLVGSSQALRLGDALALARADLKRQVAAAEKGPRGRGRPAKEKTDEPAPRPRPKPRPKPSTGDGS